MFCVCDAAPAAGGPTHPHYMGRVSPPYQLPGEAMQWVTDIRTCAETAETPKKKL